ncbi:MAG: hypothetical protein RQ966_11510 [Acetobacteraceae bacterium]|nr:hypothetical protein [Acetobacteraceae bacterium]
MDSAPFTRYLIVFTVTLVLWISVVWAYTAWFPMAYRESGYVSWAAKKAMLDGCELGQIAFFGDSRLEAGFDPADFTAPSTNFALAAGTAIEARVAIDRALACPTLPRQAVISLAPEHFGPVSSFYWLLSIRYGFLSAGDVLAVQRLAAQLGDTETLATRTPEGLSGAPRDWLYAAGFPSLSFSSLVRGRIFGRYSENQARLATAKADRGWAAYVGGDPLRAEHPGRFIVTALQNAEFEAALSALRDRGVAAAILIMPYAQTHEETGPVLAAYRDYLADMAKRTGATLLDPEIPIWPAPLFADGAHLKPSSAHAFTAELAACLADGRLAAPCEPAAPGE